MIDIYDPALEESSFEFEDKRRRPSWLYMFVGFILGLAFGLGYSWGLNPVQFYNTDPVDLRPEHKETWIILSAAAYRQDGDLDRAQSRLAGLEDFQVGEMVADLTLRYIQNGGASQRTGALVALSDALGARRDEMMIYLATPGSTAFLTPTSTPRLLTATPSLAATHAPSPTPTPTSTRTRTVTPTTKPLPTATDTPSPTSTSTSEPTDTATATATRTRRPTATRQPTATRPPPYSLEGRERLCEPQQETPRIEIVVQTEQGAGVPGTPIWVTWSGGVDLFVTGLKPELGLGYADFDMAPDKVYAVAIGDPTLRIASGLRADSCISSEGTTVLASWRLLVVATSSAFTPTPTSTAIPVPSPSATVTPTSAATPTTSPPTRTSIIR